MKIAVQIAGSTALTALALASGSLPAAATTPTPPNQATAPAIAGLATAPTLPNLVAYVRAGDIYASKGATEARLTTDGGYSRPRWSPDGRQLAVLKAGRLWTMKADGTAKRRLTTRAAAGPSWSPDGKAIAFASLSCSGGPGVYRISATIAGAQPEVLFPRDCRGLPLPAEPAATISEATVLSDRLRYDDAVAWSPDGTRVAFRGGDCESIYDACLSIGTVATGGERTVAAYGGGSVQNSGFAVIPSWRADGVKLAWTAYQQGETKADDKPVHLVEFDAVSGAKRVVGGALDREMVYVDATRGLATGQYKGGSWVLVVGLAGGVRTPFRAGSQPTVQLAAR